MAGGILEIIGLLALLVGAGECLCRAFPRGLRAEFEAITGDIAAPIEDGPQRLRDRGAL